MREIYVYSNTCDSMVFDTFEGTLEEAINMFYRRFENVRACAIKCFIGNKEISVPGLSAVYEDGESWWEYTMIL